MTPEEIIDNNKLIAKFMGEKFYMADMYNSLDEIIGTRPEVRFKAMLVGDSWGKYSNSHNQDELCYHLHWDWLMPVVEKIEILTKKDTEITFWGGLQRFLIMEYDNLNDLETVGKTKIEATYNGVLKFIKWHEGNKDILS